MFLQADPFPDPTHAGQEIENIGIMFGSILIMLVVIALMIYLYSKKDFDAQVIILFLFSIIFGLSSLELGIPFTPNIQIFFILFQTTFFIDYALRRFNGEKEKRRKRGY